LSLVVDANAPDQTLRAGAFGSSFPSRHSAFLAHGVDPATGRPGAYVHANVAARVMRGGQDVSAQHCLWRRLRYWDIRNSAPETFVNLTKSVECSRDWFDDNLGGSGFLDTPGQVIDPRGLGGYQMLYEFVVFIDKHQASVPGAYFFLIFSVGRSTYEVIRSSMLTVPFSKWKAIETSDKPWLIGKGMTTTTSSVLARP
jgi:hypothetical protein